MPDPTVPNALSPLLEMVWKVGSEYNAATMLMAVLETPNLLSAISMALWPIESSAGFQSSSQM